MASQPQPAAPRRPSPAMLLAAAILALAVIAVLVFLLNRPPDLASGATTVPTLSPPPTVPASAAGTSQPTPSPTTGPAPSGVLVIATPTPRPTASPTPRPTPTPNTNPTIVSFTAPSTVTCSGTEVRQITLSWRVERATGVELAIDGPGKYDDYPATATVEVPFACSESQHTYRITTTGGSGPAATQQRIVRRT